MLERGRRAVWLVAMRPSGDTNDAEHPPRLITAESTPDVGSESSLGSMASPSSFSFAACTAICCGIHMPPGFSKRGGSGW